MFGWVHVWACTFEGQRSQHPCHLNRYLYLIPEHSPTLQHPLAVTSHCSFIFCVWPPAALLALCGSHCLFFHISHEQDHKYVHLSVFGFFKTHTKKTLCACLKYTHAHACMFTHVSVGAWVLCRMSAVSQEWRSDGNPGWLSSSPAGWRPGLLLFTAVHTRLAGPGAYSGSPISTPGMLGLLSFMQALGIQTQVFTLV